MCDKFDFQAQMQIQIYLGQKNLANTNANIIGMTFFQGILIQLYLDSNVLDDYKSQFIRVYQKWANMNKNTTILTDICE